MKSMLRLVEDPGKGIHYTALMFVCPGCALDGTTGLHLLPVNTENTKPAWIWDGNYDRPTISPSILTKGKKPENEDEVQKICHCYLKDGWFDFLSDCTHGLKGCKVPIPDLPTWVLPEPPTPFL